MIFLLEIARHREMWMGWILAQGFKMPVEHAMHTSHGFLCANAAACFVLNGVGSLVSLVLSDIFVV